MKKSSLAPHAALALALGLALGFAPAPPALAAPSTPPAASRVAPAPDSLSSPESERAVATAEHVFGLVRGAKVFHPFDTAVTDLAAALGNRPIEAARPAILNEKIAKWLVPVRISDREVGGFAQVSADGKSLLALPVLHHDGTFQYAVSKTDWDRARTVNEIPALREFLPLKDEFSKGVPIEPRDHPDFYFVRGALDELPCRTQEESIRWVDWVNANLHPAKPWTWHEGRRTGSSKCLSYATAYVADFWATQLGHRLAPYTDFVSGRREYGTNPRLLEVIYQNRHDTVSKKDYWYSPVGKDRVTGERIPWSPKRYAVVLADPPKGTVAQRTVPDSIFPNALRYVVPEQGFHMDLPPVQVKNGPSGSKADIRDALHRYGMLLGQHTQRIFGIPTPHIGIHAVAIVGYGYVDGKMHLVYRETFGAGHKDYLEDSMGGPSYRMLPVYYFYQAIAFPHRLFAELTNEGGAAIVTVKNHEGGPTEAEKIEVLLDGKPAPAGTAQKIAPGRYRIDAKGARALEVRAYRTYFEPAVAKAMLGMSAAPGR